MGLEMTELVMACEEEFGIQPDRQADRKLYHVETVGDLYLWVMELIPDQRTRRCPWSSVFFALRRAFAEQIDTNKRMVRPDTAMCELIPEIMRKQDWELIRRMVPFPLPEFDVAISIHFRGMVDHAIRKMHPGFGPNGRPWDVDSVWDELKQIISERLDVDIARLGPETHFWHDLGAS